MKNVAFVILTSHINHPIFSFFSKFITVFLFASHGFYQNSTKYVATLYKIDNNAMKLPKKMKVQKSFR